jgi:mitochondrial fusion and transport protein UGO1
VLSTLWSSEGAWGIWKGSNSTFWHGVLLSTITSFLRSFFCAVLSLPDPTLNISSLPSPSSLIKLDILSSPSPLLSLLVSVSASGIAGLILAPLDIARTKLIATPSTHPPRSILSSVRSIGSWTITSSIAHITFLHSTLPTLISASTPLFLRTQLGLDPTAAPTTYAAATFISQAVEIGIKLPIETVLRRGQLAVANSTSPPPSPRSARSHTSDKTQPTTIDIGPYKGLFGTMYHIVYEEGSRSESKSSTSAVRGGSKGSLARSLTVQKRKKGQGVEGLWRGWRVGAWGLFGIWTAHFVGGGSTGNAGEF